MSDEDMAPVDIGSYARLDGLYKGLNELRSMGRRIISAFPADEGFHVIHEETGGSYRETLDALKAISDAQPDTLERLGIPRAYDQVGLREAWLHGKKVGRSVGKGEGWQAAINALEKMDSDT